MRILVQHGHTVLGAIKRYRLSRARDLELELLSVRRDLSALRDDYLQLGVQASTLAGERDTAIAARKKTEVYITFLRDNCEVEGEGGQLAADTDQGRSTRQVAQTGTGNGNGQSENTSPGAGWNARDTLKEYFTPRSLLLEAELASLQCELARLGDDYLDLAERTNTIACERDAALTDLNKAQVFVETLVSGLGAAHQNGGQTSDAAADDAVDRLDAVREKLARTQAEKNDLSIKLAESEDRVAEFRLQETQLHEELDTLKQCLSDSDKENNAAFRKVQQLADELEKAGIAADGKNQFMAGELRRVHNEYAEIRGKEQRHTEGLERRFAELELALVAANRTSDGFKQALADASVRQKVKSRHARLPASELDEGSSQREESRNAAQHGKPASTAAAMAGRQASHISWTRSVAGFVFLLGVLASMAKIWDIDSQVIRHAGVGKAIDVGAGERHAAAPRSAGQAPLSETIEIAALDTSEIQPGVVEDEARKAESAGKKAENKKQVSAPKLKDTAIVNIGNTGAKRKRMTGSDVLVRVYLMEETGAIDNSYNTCLLGGGSAEECAFLEKNIFEEGVIQLPSGVQYTVGRNGTGASPGPDDTVLVSFRGMLLDGTEFDSSQRHGGAVWLRLDEAIPGLQDVLQYMEEGAKWEVYIPAALAFKRPAAFGGQPVVFELELISIEDS